MSIDGLKYEMNKIEKYYYQMLLIRHFEERLLEKYSQGVFCGTTHAYIGQEANAVGIINHLEKSDIIFGNHRSHGHFIAYCGEVEKLLAEIMGKRTGMCGGRGGSQHLHYRNFYSNGIQGGIVPNACGMALAEKMYNHDALTVVFLGDGTLGEGIVYETLNIAALWKIPILFIVENNGIAQTTPVEKALAGTIAERFRAFGIHTRELTSSDVLQIDDAAADQVAYTRKQCLPSALIINTHRLCPHSKGDDTRSGEAVDECRKFDPLLIHVSRIDEGHVKEIEKAVSIQLDTAFENASNASSAEM